MIVYTFAIFILLLVLLRYAKCFYIPGLSKWSMPVAFAVKALVGLVFIYTYSEADGRMNEDAGVFMRESMILNDVFYSSPGDYFKFLTGYGESQEMIHKYLEETTHWDIGVQSIINDNKNIIRLHSLIHFFSFGRPVIHMLIFAFFALVGIRQLFLGIKVRSEISPFYLFWGIVFLPSVLFWTSSVLKEPLMLLGFGLLIRSLLSKTFSWYLFILGIIGSVLLFSFKSYVLIAFIPALLFFGLSGVLPKYKIVGGLGITVLLFLLGFLLFSNQRDNAIHLLSRKQLDFKNVARGGIHAQKGDDFYFFEERQLEDLNIKNDTITVSKSIDVKLLQLGQMDKPIPTHLNPGTDTFIVYFQNEPCNGYLELTPINNSYSQLIKNVPQAMMNSLIRPLPNDPGSKLKYPAFLEVLLVIFALVFSFVKRRKISLDDQILIMVLILFALCLSLIIGWITPVVGAIVRYRIPVFISLLIIAAMVFNPFKKIKS